MKILYSVIQPFDDGLYQEARGRLSPTYVADIEAHVWNPQKRLRAIIARYVVSRELELLTGLWFEPTLNDHHCDIGDTTYYRSFSYTDTSVFIVLSDERVGADIELIRPREKELLTTYAVGVAACHSSNDAPRDAFYRFRCACEATIKCCSLGFNDLEDITIMQCRRNEGSATSWDIVTYYPNTHTTCHVNYAVKDGKYGCAVAAKV